MQILLREGLLHPCWVQRPRPRLRNSHPGQANILDVLAKELARPAWAGEQVALGTATDCYQPAEPRYRLTRALLEVLLAHRNPVGLVTEAPLVLSDMDLLAALARVAKVRVFFTITTVDP